jgi:hypothetical protein
MSYKFKAFVNKLCLAFAFKQSKKSTKAKKETIYITSLILIFALY